jgi:hypothetical protein
VSVGNGSMTERVRQARATIRLLRGLRPPRGGAGRTGGGTGWSDVLAGLGETYRWAREAMAAAYAGGDQVEFARWRVALACHGVQLRRLAALCPGDLDGRQEVVARLGELLRQDARLTRLAAGGWEEPGRPPPPGLVDQRHQALRALARPLGRRLFAEPPASFCRVLDACCRAQRRRHEQPLPARAPVLRAA